MKVDGTWFLGPLAARINVSNIHIDSRSLGSLAAAVIKGNRGPQVTAADPQNSGRMAAALYFHTHPLLTVILILILSAVAWHLWRIP